MISFIMQQNIPKISLQFIKLLLSVPKTKYPTCYKNFSTNFTIFRQLFISINGKNNFFFVKHNRVYYDSHKKKISLYTRNKDTKKSPRIKNLLIFQRERHCFWCFPFHGTTEIEIQLVTYDHLFFVLRISCFFLCYSVCMVWENERERKEKKKNKNNNFFFVNGCSVYRHSCMSLLLLILFGFSFLSW